MFYLVEVLIDHPIADDWQRWMTDTHIPDVVNTGCFTRAWITRHAEADTDQQRAYKMVYLARSPEDFARYQHDHAPALQADHTSRYEGRFQASRQLLDVLDDFSK